jgi:hypothetical protein
VGRTWTAASSDPEKPGAGDDNLRAIMTGGFLIEVEDFNFGTGKHEAVSDTMPYLGNAYAGLTHAPALDIDFFSDADKSGGAAFAYNRFNTTDPGVVEMKGPGDAVDNALGRLRGSFSVNANYATGWTAVGDWQNYTRVFPKGKYGVIMGAAHDGVADTDSGSGLPEIDIVLSKVANPTVADGSASGAEGGAQGLTKLGTFLGGGTGAWSSNDLVPLVNDAGAPVLVDLDGATTLRVSFNNQDGDGDFMLFYCTDCPSIQITSPANNATFAEGANVPITVTTTVSSGTVAKVEYFANGAKIGESTTAPFSFTVPNAPSGAYTVTAVVTDSSGRTATSSAINVVVGTPPNVLFVHGATPTGSDTAIIAALRQAGMVVVAKDAPNTTTADANGRSLVVVSSTVTSGDVGTKFRDVAVPVVNWEQAVQDDFLMTLNTDTVTRGTATGQTQLDIVNAAHPMAAGLSGTVTIATAPTDISWGQPADTAVKIATIAGDATKVALYGYDTGAKLIDGTTSAPARRVHAFMTDNAYNNLNADGRKLVTAAVAWALGGGTVNPQPEITSISRVNDQVTIVWTGGGTLFTAPVVTGGTWTSTGDSDGSYTTTASAAEAYFRVQK